jgi:hypothetical protein
MQRRVDVFRSLHTRGDSDGVDPVPHTATSDVLKSMAQSRTLPRDSSSCAHVPASTR